MESQITLVYAFASFMICIKGETTETIRIDNAFNPNVPPGFILGGSSANNSGRNHNSSTSHDTNVTSNWPLVLLNTSRSSIIETTKSSFSMISPRASSVLPSIYKQTFTDQTQTKPTNVSSEATRTTLLKTMTTASSNLPIKRSNVTNDVKSSLPTTVLSISHQMTKHTDLNSTNLSRVSISVTTSEPTNFTDTNFTTETNIVSSTNHTLLLNSTQTVRRGPTTDPFNDNRPWNLRRSTSHPQGDGSWTRKTTTEPYADDYDNGDTFWPVAVALTIGIPTITVFAVTITVLYRRRMNKPRGLLGVYGTEYQTM